jgi:AraC-like DNA-binding protein/tetratricopeptide (TPR) repeat protein
MQEPLSPDQIFIRKLTDIVLANLENENFGVKELVRESNMSRHKLSQSLRSINGEPINQFIREIRLHKAFEILQNKELTVSEVAYKVGFGSPVYFSKCFHEFFGYPPGKVKKADLDIEGLNIQDQVSTEQKSKKSPIIEHILSLPGILILVSLLVMTGFLLYSKIHKATWTDALLSPDGRIAIAIMPFSNMTNDTTLNIWQGVLQECLISSLSNCKELKVRQKESVSTLLKLQGFTQNLAIPPGIAGKISQTLEANIFIYGSIKQSGARKRVDVQLISTKTSEVIKSITSEGSLQDENMFQVIDSLTNGLRNFLLISKLIKENPEYGRFPLSTNSPEALRYCIYGDNAKNTALNNEGWNRAIDWYLKALAIDSNYFTPMIGLTTAYYMLGRMEDNLHWLVKLNQKKDKWPLMDQLGASWAYAYSFEPPEEGLKYLKQIQQIDDQTPGVSYLIGVSYIEKLEQYDNAIPEFETAVKIYHKWGVDDSWYYSELGTAYHKTGQYQKEKRLYRKAAKYVKDDQWIIARRAILSLSEKDTVAANSYIEKLTSFLNKNSFPESEIKVWIARVYRDAGNIEKAEEYFRKALSLDPENPALLNTFADFLARNKRSPEEFLSTINKAIELAPSKYDYYNYLDTKGYGLFKLGKYHEALEIMQKMWDSTPFKMYFIKSHLNEVKKAI